MDAIYYEINEADARAAHEANSMGGFDFASEVEGYRERVDDAYRMADEQAERFPEVAERAYALADAFAHRYAEWLNAGYRIDAMCPSILISGGGNFPVRKKERQNARRDAHMKRYEGIIDIKRRIATVGTGGIQSGDPDAIERLEARARRLEERHGMMKRANAWYRKHGNLDGFDGMGADEREEALKWMRLLRERQPFPSYTVANCLASIKRARRRIEDLQREKESGTEDRGATINGEQCTVVENSGIMRLQLVFEDKPDAGTRSMLKSEGFRWSPKNGAWQRQLTDNARRALKRLEQMGR